CEPSTQVILFDRSYDDYKLAKEEEQGAYQLVLNLSGRFEMKELSFTVKNALDEVVEGVKVKITKPDNSVFEVQTDSTGLFKWTPDVIGMWKIQGGKDNYESTRLNEIEIFQSQQYLIVIKVNGKQKAEYKSGDRLTFELRDINNTLIPLTIDATFAGLPLRFISGISDDIIFEDTSTLIIPATEGYIEQSLQLTAKKANWSNVLWTIGIIIAIIVVLVLVVAIVRKVKGSEKPTRKMEFQLGEGE
ncbi:MAG: carboxypeptidase-like regulatory domain-containing protein, partial [Nitrosopumilus sp.]